MMAGYKARTEMQTREPVILSAAKDPSACPLPNIVLDSSLRSE
jgi:hypothetical protein